MRSVAAAFMLLVASTAAGQTSAARAIAFTRTDIPGDVPAHLVTALAQDRHGFLWIGTQGGLVRYDGYTYRVFTADAASPSALGANYVRALHVGADGRIWIGTFSGGVSVFDPATDSFTTYRQRRGDPTSLAHDRVEGLAEDAQGRIWIATEDGLDALDPRSGRIEHFRHTTEDATSLADNQVRAVLIDRAGRLWVGTRNGLQRREGNRFIRVASDPATPASLNGQLVMRLLEDSRGRIWIGTTEHGGAVYDPQQDTLRRLPPRVATGLSHFWVYALAEASDGAIWIGTFGSGIDIVDPTSLAIVERLRHDPGVPDTIGGDRVGALLRDRSGVMWVGSWGEGLARHDPTTRAFTAIRHSPQRAGLSHPAAVRALPVSDGTIWVGTNGAGVDVFDAEWRVVAHHAPNPGQARALTDGAITCLAEGGDGSVWVATLDGVLHRQRPGTTGFERVTTRHGLPGGAIRAMIVGPNGEVWAGSANGLARIDPSTMHAQAFLHSPADERTISARGVEALAFTADGVLWVGTTNGLNAFDPAQGVATRIHADAARADALPNAWVPDLMVASDGRLWVGTQGGAAILRAWDGRTATFERVAERLGRRPEPAESLIEDLDGHVWIGARLRVDPREWTAREFGAGDAREFRSYFIASRARTADGSLLFGSPEGLLAVQPRRLQAWDFDPPIVATSIAIGERRHPGATATLTLAPGDRAFHVDFAALDLTAPGRNAYRYVLEGFDRDWQQVDASRRSLSYTNLPPGVYRLRVQGTNRSGRWSSQELALTVEVLPAWYQTTAFQAAAVIVLVALVYGSHRLRVRRMMVRGRELEELVEARTAELRKAYERIEEASLTDALTGLRNRRFLQQAVEVDAASVLRLHAGPDRDPATSDLVFLLIDLDHFKHVNDTHGHAAGDAVLVQLAGVLRSLFRASDHVARWGGEEFLVVARFTDRRRGPELAEKIRAAIATHHFLLPDGEVMKRTASVGFAAYPCALDNPQRLSWTLAIEMADAGLYRAKRSGRNRWVGVEPSPGADADLVKRDLAHSPEAGIDHGLLRPITATLLALALLTGCARTEPSPAAPTATAAAALPIPTGDGRPVSVGGDMRELEPFTGDLADIAERGAIRVLVAPSQTHYEVTQGRERGRTVDAAIAFEGFVNQRLAPRSVRVVLIASTESTLIPDLVAGRADVAANVLRTFAREDQVAFATPLLSGVREIVVTGPGAAPLVSLEDVGGRTVHVRRNSDHHASLIRLNEQLKRIDRPPAKVVLAEDTQTDEALLQLVNDGRVPATIVNDYVYDARRAALPATHVNRDVAVSQDGEIAWVTRKESVRLVEVINEFFATHALFGRHP